MIAGIGGLARGKKTSAVCCFLWFGCFAPIHDFSLETTQPQQTSPGPSDFSSGDSEGEGPTPLHTTPARKASDNRGRKPGGGQNKLSSLFLSLAFRRLTPRHDFSIEKTRPQQISHGPSEPAPPRPLHEPQPNTGPPGPHAPAQPFASKLKPADIGQRIFHYSRCTGKKKAVCVRQENLIFIF